jgi:hypothetical protein
MMKACFTGFKYVQFTSSFISSWVECEAIAIFPIPMVYPKLAKISRKHNMFITFSFPFRES